MERQNSPSWMCSIEFETDVGYDGFVRRSGGYLVLVSKGFGSIVPQIASKEVSGGVGWHDGSER